MGFEHGRCECCSRWQPARGLGRCNSPKVAPDRHADADDDSLVVIPSKLAEVRTGPRFGCIHWEPADDAVPGQGSMSAQELKALLAEKGIKPSKLAALLGVRRQRVSDWLTGRRNVPALAVAALKAMGMVGSI